MRRVLACLAVIALALVGAPAAAHADNGPTHAVIVTSVSAAAAARAVDAVGGTVDVSLPIVNGVGAHVDAQAEDALASMSSVMVVPDVELHATSANFDVTSNDPQIGELHPGRDFAHDAGRGVTVAIVDTGVSDTPDLHGDRLVRSPDFSGENDGVDHYGHGTFMAGLIAGDGSASANGPVHHVGIAPGATVVAVKVAKADGSTSMSRLIAGIGWVVTHRDSLHIGVMNLSFGVDLPMPYHANPLSAAVEVAWATGVTVVVAAGNEGAGSVTSPGDDPYVITAGASDGHGNVASWSGSQDFHGYAKPDVVAPGVSVVSLRDPGSTVDTQHPEGRLGDAYFRGTGTSMSTALVSGSAAVLLSHHPDATPDDIKGALVDGATTLGNGAREVDIQAADDAPASPDWWQHYKIAYGGLGGLLKDGMPWTGTRWTGTRWTATRWRAEDWDATRWRDEAWSATRWRDEDWAATRWSADSWDGTRWSGTRWSAVTWPSQGWG
jgi:serine protease AprX